MRAVWMTGVGGPEVLRPGDAPDPVPASGQVLVDVSYAGITFVETQLRAGTGPFPARPPVILGNGVAGIVTAVGDSVPATLLGRRVAGTTGGSGGYAERAAVAVDDLVEVPDGVGLDTAVALLADGRTALLLMGAVAPRAGERVLVEAAAGGVGSLLVQLARSAGAVVVGAAGGERKVGLVTELGADLVVDYTRPDWTQQIRTALGGVDVVFDGVGGAIARSAFTLLEAPPPASAPRPVAGPRMISFGLASGSWAGIPADAADQAGVTLLGLPRPTPARARDSSAAALDLAAAGSLRPLIGQRFQLDQAAEAHAQIESRQSTGKSLLTPTP